MVGSSSSASPRVRPRLSSPRFSDQTVLVPQAKRILDADVAECRRDPQVPSSTGRYGQNPIPRRPEGCPNACKPLESQPRSGKFPKRSNRELNRPIREPNPPNRNAPENSKLERIRNPHSAHWEPLRRVRGAL